MRVMGGDCVKYLKRGGTEKRGGETKILKRGGKLVQGVGALKRKGRGDWNPLTNYEFISSVSLTMVGEKFQIYSVQITGKCICETFPPPLYVLIIRPHVNNRHKFAQKKPPILWEEGGDTMLYLHIFSHF